MPRPRRPHLLALFAVLALGTIALTLWMSRPAPPRYSVIDLGSLPGYARVEAVAVNSRGDVTCSASNFGSGTGRACVYRGGRLVNLGVLPGFTDSTARDMNSRGEVVGGAYASGHSTLHAFLYSRGKMQDLGTLPGFTNSTGVGINDRGEIAGDATSCTPIYTQSVMSRGHAFFYSHGKMTDLGVPPGCVESHAQSISATGQVVGNCLLTSGLKHPFLYDSRTRTMTLPAVPAPYREGWAYQVNDNGQVIGDVSTADGTCHGALWRGNRMTDMGTVPGFTSAVGTSLNNRGQAVGSSYYEPSFLRGRLGRLLKNGIDRRREEVFVWDMNRMINLNELIPAHSGWTLEWAGDVNDQGQIVGYGEHDGQERAFLLTPLR